MKIKSLVLSLSFCFVLTLQAQVSVDLKCNQKYGWMPDGWGSFKMTIKNESDAKIKLKKWELRWDLPGEQMASVALDKVLSVEETWVKDEIGNLPKTIVDAFGSKAPKRVGFLTIEENGIEKKIPMKVEIPAAYLPEPSKVVTKGKVSVSLMEFRYDNFKTVDRAMGWFNESYELMEDLVGGQPYGGGIITFKESPQNPYFAYAGKDIILNTDFVGGSVAEFESGIYPFGWIHEMGHDFDDGIGHWYNVNHPFTEFQANFKLSYITENMEDQSFRIPQTINVADYPIQEPRRRLKSREFTEKSFLIFGDKYLADPSRNWESMSSDDIHCLFQRIQRAYGWDVFKGWYRMYRYLTQKGYSPPDSVEDRISLMVAILNVQTDVNLVPLFKTWRFNVTEVKVDALTKKYKLNKAKFKIEKGNLFSKI